MTLVRQRHEVARGTIRVDGVGGGRTEIERLEPTKACQPVLRTAAATRGAAGALLIDRTSRMVLLVERVYDTVWSWGLPGGIIEAGESPLGACRREIREELGIGPIIEHLAAIDWVPPRPPKTAGNMYLFTDHPTAQARIRLDPVELSAWTWVTPSEIPHLLPRAPRRRRPLRPHRSAHRLS